MVEEKNKIPNGIQLVIVESPTKSKTIERFLGKGYRVLSSFGHVRDLPKGELGIDIENNFQPKYVIPPRARKVINLLKKEAKSADKIILASVDYEEPTLIQYPDGLIRMEKVGKFIDWLIKSNISPSRFRVSAFDFRSHRISFKPIKHVVRHSVKEKLLKITTDYGRTITVTPSHSLFQKDKNGNIKTVAGNNLRKGDLLLTPTIIPRGRKDLSKKRIDILKAIYENEELKNNTFIKSSSVARYRRSRLLAPREGDSPQLAPRIFFTDALRNKLQKQRIDYGWSQKTLAEQIDCSQSDISEWESGQGRPTLNRGEHYLHVLGLDIDELVTTKKLTIGPSSIEQAIARALKTQWNDSRKSKSRSWQPLSWFTWEELNQHFSNDETIEISRSNHSHCMPRFIPVNEDLMLFLGFFTAEGSFLTQGKYTRFSFGPKTHGAEGAHIERIREISRRLFNLTPSDFKHKTDHTVVLNSTLVTFFLKEIIGIKRGARHKEVPHLVFNISSALQFSFLKGYFLGDGSLGKTSITFSTASRSLAQGISYILLQNNITPSYSLAIAKKPNKPGTKPQHQVIVTGKEKLTAIHPVWEEHYKAQQLEEYCQKNRHIKANYSLAKNKNGDLALLRIKNIIQVVEPLRKYVYDFSVDGENFICGNGGVCAHNTDEDREGEAIAWHLSEVLKLKNPKRIVFHEITREAIERAIKNPRKLENNLIDAQQARRVLDRLVGYKLSPFLWKKIARGLSAGRVQSVAVRLIAEKEEEIKKFKSEEYWLIEALLQKIIKQPFGESASRPAKLQIPNNNFTAQLYKKNNDILDKLAIKNKNQADEILSDLKGAEYQVEKVEKKETKRNPYPPFTTSTLQQECSKRFRMPAKITMMIAQALYEKGYITYHRTDSVNLSSLSLGLAKKYIEDNIGKNYHNFRQYKSKSNAQEAHEAIRPTYPSKNPESLKLEPVQKKVYDLIWRRFLACQMKPAVFNSTAYDIKAKNYIFRANGQIMKFDGFLKVYPQKYEEIDLPDLKEKEILDLKEIIPSQHFTKPPARYTEASLIKELEENGIGRPSTYAPIISTIQERNYVEKNEEKRFQPTEIGTVVNDILVKHFPQIVDINFTAKLEKELDEIAQGKDNYVKTCQDFYTPFEKNLKEKYEQVEKKDITEKPTDKKCPKCGSDLIIRIGKYGRFYACSAFPKCRYTESLEKRVLDIDCPKCKKGKLTEKRTKKNKIFYGCDQFPECDYALWDKPTGEKCPKCSSLLVETKRKQVKCSHKDCQFKKNMAE